MPCRYAIDPRGGNAIVTATGSVTGEEIQAVQRAMLADPQFERGAPVLCDFLGADLSGITSEAIRALAAGSGPDRGPRAIVVAEGLPYGLARMFEAYSSMHQQNTEVFTTIADARKWLGLGPRPQDP